ncbi:hypothetical protein DFJ77DRAFT_341620 [Powellomyces hirtus]|nr:hypothetical protein DFJ77DRAFT_341620 [Powellomyces hirtus]
MAAMAGNGGAGTIDVTAVSLRSAALTLLSALENLMLIDERGQSKASASGPANATKALSAAAAAGGNGSQNGGDTGGVAMKRRGSERNVFPTPILTATDMDIDGDHYNHNHQLQSNGQKPFALLTLDDAISPLKRKRAASALSMPNAKAHRLSAALSSRLQRSLKVADQHHSSNATIDNTCEPSPDVDLRDGQSQHVRNAWSEFGGRRLSRLPKSESCCSLSDELLNNSSTAGTGASSSYRGDLYGSSSIYASSSPSPSVMSSREVSRAPSSSELLDRSSISSWIESQAFHSGEPLSKVQANWEEKRREFECNLTLLANGVPSDSYQDLKSITENIVDAAKWLSAGNLDELGELVPLWKATEPNIDNLIRYIRIVEDMKSTAAMSFHLSGALDADLKRMKECLDQKKALWGTVLVDGALTWQTLGFPVDELQHLLNAAAGWVYGLPWSLLVQLDAEFHKFDARGHVPSSDPETHVLMERIFNGLVFAQECAEFVGKSFQQRVQYGAYGLTAAFFIFTLTLFETLSGTRTPHTPNPSSCSSSYPSSSASGKARSTEVRAMQLFGNLVKLLEALRSMKGAASDDHLDGTSATGTTRKHHSRHDHRPTAARYRHNANNTRLHSPLTPDFPDAPAFPLPSSLHPSPHTPSSTATTAAPPAYHAGQLEALDKFSRVVVEAGLQICEYVAARLPKTNVGGGVASAESGDGMAPTVTMPSGKHVLVLLLAVRYVQAAVELAGVQHGDRIRLQRLIDTLPPGSLT